MVNYSWMMPVSLFLYLYSDYRVLPRGRTKPPQRYPYNFQRGKLMYLHRVIMPLEEGEGGIKYFICMLRNGAIKCSDNLHTADRSDRFDHEKQSSFQLPAAWITALLVGGGCPKNPGNKCTLHLECPSSFAGHRGADVGSR